jgi:hypothetical protein
MAGRPDHCSRAKGAQRFGQGLGRSSVEVGQLAPVMTFMAD